MNGHFSHLQWHCSQLKELQSYIWETIGKIGDKSCLYIFLPRINDQSNHSHFCFNVSRLKPYVINSTALHIKYIGIEYIYYQMSFI